MTVDLVLYGSEPHYIEHLAPIAAAFAPSAVLYCGTQRAQAAARRALQGYDAALVELGRPSASVGPPVLVASYRDARRIKRSRPLGLLEHGSGQTYADAPDDPHYAGGSDWERASLILSPGPHAAAKWRRAYPAKPVVELGGSPRLDPVVPAEQLNLVAAATPHDALLEHLAHPMRDACNASEKPVGVTFHWQAPGNVAIPEQGSGFHYWAGAVSELAARREVVGHAHPRAWASLSAWYRRAGIRAVEHFDELLGEAGLLIGDNSSALYEWAGLGRPVLCLDWPACRREVEHGLRFWSAPPGHRIAEPEILARAVAAHLEDPVARESREAGEAGVAEAYGGPLDGRATERAVAAIREHLLGS